MLERTPEPELMDDPDQARAYAEADFEAPHQYFVDLFGETFPHWRGETALDLGCGPADITLRFARRYPACRIDGLDGSEAMLRLGRRMVDEEGLGGRIRLVRGYLPGADLPRGKYDAIISNSLLHHLADPMALWNAVRAHAGPGAPVFVMDLMRPATLAQARDMIQMYADGEPEVLQRDFYHSLLAAYRVEEVESQLAAAGLERLSVRPVSDRHLVVSGLLP